MLVFGGSLGARSINEASVDAFRDAPFRVLHACGRRDYEALRERLGSPPPANYDLREYISPFGPALAAADLTLARAGGSIFEVAAAGLPAVLVPYPHAAADHQTANARWMTDAGAAVVIRDEDVTPQKLDEVVGALLQDPAKLAAMAEASRALARPDAARDIANEVLAAAARGPSVSGSAGDRPWAGRRVHLVGVGGAGMSGWARVAVQLGATVSGSDRAESPNLDRLRALGITVHVGHDAANVPDGRRRLRLDRDPGRQPGARRARPAARRAAAAS